MSDIIQGERQELIIPQKHLILPNGQGGLFSNREDLRLFEFLKDYGWIEISEGKQFEWVKQRFEKNHHNFCMQLLGRLAEFLIVEECRNVKQQNQKWFAYAELNGLNIPPKISRAANGYIAVGTGLKDTQRYYFYHYNPSDPQRDIIWIPKTDSRNTILVKESNKYAGRPAGLQIKVSSNFEYIKDILISGRYIYPIIYFDLNDDFYLLHSYCSKQQSANFLRYSLVRGKEISPSIHENLIYYQDWLMDILKGKRQLDDLLQRDRGLREATQDNIREMALGHVENI